MSTVLEAADEASTTLDQTAYNVAVWRRLLADPALAALPFRIETDQHGQMIMSPPPAPLHSARQSEIARLLGNWNPRGRVLTECPISTARGIKSADVAWCSQELWQAAAQEPCFVQCPEICVEVLSPSNSGTEIDEKRRLYFDAGAREVWICAKDGGLRFHARKAPETPLERSLLCPDFPTRID